ncbi:hypothetical protein CDL12_02140 [Handroanthus impetiginosus]|uniref:Uncharacterized protein n=1 Tax=Handroanthus impetiginosus TaxID=429701 RepID=A0A2G9I5U9_9LAMI|nr:hypothetical protein CDL12_02140 [Handroanthus impetiginosus]
MDFILWQVNKLFIFFKKSHEISFDSCAKDSFSEDCFGSLIVLLHIIKTLSSRVIIGLVFYISHIKTNQADCLNYLMTYHNRFYNFVDFIDRYGRIGIDDRKETYP